VFKSILIICVGNICRSPTAEYLFRRHLSHLDVKVGSAGLSAMRDHPIDETAAQVMEEHGVDGSPHRARQIDPELLRESDLILVMEQRQIEALARFAPEARGKIFLLGKWLEAQNIPDPYRQQRAAFEHAYDLIDRSVLSWLPYLQ